MQYNKYMYDGLKYVIARLAEYCVVCFRNEIITSTNVGFYLSHVIEIILKSEFWHKNVTIVSLHMYATIGWLGFFCTL